jgi:hypothetical protein
MNPNCGGNLRLIAVTDRRPDAPPHVPPIDTS